MLSAMFFLLIVMGKLCTMLWEALAGIFKGWRIQCEAMETQDTLVHFLHHLDCDNLIKLFTHVCHSNSFCHKNDN